MLATSLLFLLPTLIGTIAAPTPIRPSDAVELALDALAEPDVEAAPAEQPAPVMRYLSCPGTNAHKSPLAYIDARPPSDELNEDFQITCAYEDAASCTYSLKSGALTSTTVADFCVASLLCPGCSHPDTQTVLGDATTYGSTSNADRTVPDIDQEHKPGVKI